MFDMLSFYNYVLGMTKYYRLLFQDPNKIIPRHGSMKTIQDHVKDIERELSAVLRCCFFNYYMKKYFAYFNLKYLLTNHGYAVFVSHDYIFKLTVLFVFSQFGHNHIALVPEKYIDIMMNSSSMINSSGPLCHATSYVYDHYYPAYCKMEVEDMARQVMLMLKDENLLM
jgi:hypothetical protein